MLVRLFRQDGLACTFHVTSRNGSYTDEQWSLFRRYAPFMRTAMLVYWRMNELEARLSATHDALDRLLHGFVLFDHEGYVVETNDAARKILRRQDGLLIKRGKLHATRSLDDAKLQKLLQDSAGIQEENSGTGGGAMEVTRHEHSAYHVVVSPVLIGAEARRLSPCRVGRRFLPHFPPQ